MMRFSPPESTSHASPAASQLAAAEPGMLTMLMASYGGSLSDADVAIWGLAQA